MSPKDLLPLWSQNKSSKTPRCVLFSRSLNDAERLVDRLMKFLINFEERSRAVLNERAREKPNLSIAGRNELLHLGHVHAINNFRLDTLPKI